eukprot:scaffold1656_cov76-Skeletonema_marinoi.AAC.1
MISSNSCLGGTSSTSGLSQGLLKESPLPLILKRVESRPLVAEGGDGLLPTPGVSVGIHRLVSMKLDSKLQCAQYDFSPNVSNLSDMLSRHSKKMSRAKEPMKDCQLLLSNIHSLHLAGVTPDCVSL